MKRYPGYYLTGDAGMIDDDGYVHIMSRIDDVINVAGHRLSTAAMEEVLVGHRDVAEAAVTVVDAYQGRGVGTLLLRQLSQSAYDNGIRSFRGYVLQNNTPMLSLLDDVGAQIVQSGDGLLVVQATVSANPQGMPAASLKDLFRAIASGRLPPMQMRSLHGELSKVVKALSRHRR